MLDALLRLTSNITVVPIDLELDFTFTNITTIYNYTAIIAEMSKDFK